MAKLIEFDIDLATLRGTADAVVVGHLTAKGKELYRRIKGRRIGVDVDTSRMPLGHVFAPLLLPFLGESAPFCHQLVSEEIRRNGPLGKTEKLYFTIIGLPPELPPLSPGWHIDGVEGYIIGSENEELNTEYACSATVNKLPEIQNYLETRARDKSLSPKSREQIKITDILRANGGTLHIGAGEVVRLAGSTLHRSAELNPTRSMTWPFIRMSVQRNNSI